MSECTYDNPWGNGALVQYNGQNIGGADPIVCPFVSKEVEYIRGFKDGAERWLEKETWTLTGEIISCLAWEGADSEGGFLTAQQTILDWFSEDFKELKVGDAKALEVLQFCKVVSIDFAESTYTNNVAYTVVIEGYRGAGALEDQYKVINPQAGYTWSEQEDGTMTLTYNISAQGIATNATTSDGLTNAQNFVEHYLDLRDGSATESPSFYPTLIPWLNPDGKRYLVSDEATIDRTTETYGITRVYRLDLTEQENSVLRYTVDVQNSFGQNTVTTFRGSIDLGYDPQSDTQPNIDLLRERYFEFKEQKLLDPYSGSYLTNIQSESVEEDPLGGILTFTIIFGDVAETCEDNFTVSVNESAESSIIKVSVNGTVTHKGACGWTQIASCFYGSAGISGAAGLEAQSTRQKLFDRANEGYQGFIAQQGLGSLIPTAVVLNANPTEYSISEDPHNNTITYSVGYDDRQSFGAHSFDYTASVTPPIQQIAVNSFESICGESLDSCPTAAVSHHYFDLGIGDRGKLGLRITTQSNGENLNANNGFPGGDIDGFAGTVRNNFISQGGKQFLIKNERGNNEAIQGTYAYEWLWAPPKDESGSPAKDVVVNSDPDDRRKVVKLFFGQE